MAIRVFFRDNTNDVIPNSTAVNPVEGDDNFVEVVGDTGRLSLIPTVIYKYSKIDQ